MLVTGAAGFIAGHVIPLLLAHGCTVVAIDDYSACTRPPPAHPLLVSYPMDIGMTERLRGVVQRHRPNVVLHLAARHVIPQCAADPVGTTEVNVGGTASLLAALDSGDEPACERLVLASSAAVYAPSDEAVCEDSPIGPIDVYGESKVRCEDLASEWAVRRRRNGPRGDRPGPSVAVCRLFNVFGPGDTNPHLLPDIVAQLWNGDDILLGNLSTRRDFVPVSYVAQILSAVTRAPLAISQVRGGSIDPFVLNIGTGQSFSATELVERIGRISRRHLRLRPVADRRRDDDRPVLRADVRKLRAVFPQFEPTGLDEALTELIAVSRPVSARTSTAETRTAGHPA